MIIVTKFLKFFQQFVFGENQLSASKVNMYRTPLNTVVKENGTILPT